MNRRTAIRRLATILLTTASCAEPEQPKKVPRIGYLVGGDAASGSARSEAIRLALRERGYLEGQNIASEYRYAEGRRDRLPELAAELVRLMDSSFLTMTLSIGRMGQG
jgi:putative ABC transport system substrate-binding protein